MVHSDYEQQVAKMHRFNKLVAVATAGFMLLIFFILTGYAIWAGNRDNAQTQRIIDELTDQTEQNRKRGDAILCMLSVPAADRNQAIIDDCLKRYGLDIKALRDGPNYE